MRTLVLVMFFLVYSLENSAEHEQLQLQELSDFAAEFDPNLGLDQWRLIPYLGWRKFAPVDAYYYDWLDFRRVTRWRWWRDFW